MADFFFLQFFLIFFGRFFSYFINKNFTLNVDAKTLPSTLFICFRYSIHCSHLKHNYIFYGYVKSTQNTWLELGKHCGHGKDVSVMVGETKTLR